jgi:hypothetical protein
MLEITQMLSSFCQPAFSFRDIRHKPQEEGPDDFSASDPRLFYHNVPTTISEQPVMAEPGSFNERRPGVEDSSETEFAERRGTTHLVHLWEAQGHPAKKVMFFFSIRARDSLFDLSTAWFLLPI